MLSLTFHGAARCVTGSCTEVNALGSRFLVDCGLFQGKKSLRSRNWDRRGIDAGKIESVVLTHAHLDHSGWLPRLVQDGFEGPIFATRATVELVGLLLRDSAHIQEEDARYANKKGYSKHKPALPLYGKKDAEAAIRRLVAVDYDDWLELGEGVRVRLHQAGHIIGSGHLEVEARHGDESRRVFFSGDVGRYSAPLVPDPKSPSPCDALVIESTYGDRDHTHSHEEVKFEHLLKFVAKSGGVVMFPAFAVGRSQQLLYLLRKVMDANPKLEMPIHLDSPMAVETTRIYERHPEESGLEELSLRSGSAPVYGANVYMHKTSDESRRLNSLTGSRVIIASSGMMTGGRILHHLKKRLPDPRNIVVIAGYQAYGTRGWRLQRGDKTVRIHGEDIPVVARLEKISGLSAHADRGELLRWTGEVVPRIKTFVNHGEDDSAGHFAKELTRRGHTTTIPELGQTYEV